MGRKMKDLTGQRIGMLTVIKPAGMHTSPCGATFKLWECRCDCGNIITTQGRYLTRATTTSCGCKSSGPECSNVHKSEWLADCVVDGTYNEPSHKVWYDMMRRCYDERHHQYKNYGAKGITVCEEWKNTRAFVDWMNSQGYVKGLTIDRIDKESGYSPENCRLMTFDEHKENWMNRLSRVMFEGKERSLREISEMTGVGYQILYSRMRHGWDIEAAVNTPVHEYNWKV